MIHESFAVDLILRGGSNPECVEGQDEMIHTYIDCDVFPRDVHTENCEILYSNDPCDQSNFVCDKTDYINVDWVT